LTFDISSGNGTDATKKRLFKEPSIDLLFYSIHFQVQGNGEHDEAKFRAHFLISGLFFFLFQSPLCSDTYVLENLIMNTDITGRLTNRETIPSLPGSPMSDV
jgi:hypothetical protein